MCWKDVLTLGMVLIRPQMWPIDRNRTVIQLFAQTPYSLDSTPVETCRSSPKGKLEKLSDYVENTTKDQLLVQWHISHEGVSATALTLFWRSLDVIYLEG